MAHIVSDKVSHMDTSMFQGTETHNTTLCLQGENLECLFSRAVNIVVGNLELSQQIN